MDELQRLRRKVEAGEPLSDSELAALERYATSAPGPTLRVALAHALMNANEDRQALTALETICRDFPDNAEARLAHARALVGLERFSDAERSLHEALRLNPGDPEAIKVLAVIGLRRGETSRARALVADALARDPFDAEARLLKEELEAIEQPAPVSLAPLAELAAALCARLVRGGLRIRRGPGSVLVALDGEIARLELKNLWNTYAAEGRTLAESVDAIAAPLEALARQRLTADAWLARVMPVLRASSFEKSAPGSFSREAPAGLRIFYVADDPSLLRYLSRAMGEQLGAEQVDAAAWANLERRPTTPAPVTVGEIAAFALSAGDGYDAARLLCRSQGDLIKKALDSDRALAWLGERERALLAPSTAAKELTSLEPTTAGLAGLFEWSPGSLRRAS